MMNFLKNKYFLISAVAVLCIALIAVLIFFVSSSDKNATSEESEVSLIETDVFESSESNAVSDEIVSKETSSKKEELPEFFISSPSSKNITVTEDHILFSGKGNPKKILTVNGEKINCDDSGNFTIEKKLKEGRNTFDFQNGKIKHTYSVTYKYVVISSYSPSGGATFDNGASIAVNVYARKGSTVTASFNGNTINLQKNSDKSDDENNDGETFVKFSGTFNLPTGNTTDKNLGKITFTAAYNGKKETKQSGDIVCRKEYLPDIAEVVYFTAETFNGNSTDDASRPTNSYLPKGTKDYVVGKAYNNGKEYLKLRCGKRVYVTKKNMDKEVTVTKQYSGKLPTSNKVGFASLNVTAQYTTITMNVDWKAPFFVEYLPQSYADPSTQNYKISSFTSEYIDITFCYAKGISGKINLGDYNPVFSSYKIIKSGSNYKLRLYLRKKGGFYGWNAEYNSKGQLVFDFLNPAQVKAASNKYGADLTGATVLIDVGHGGADSGAVGAGGLYEKNCNLKIAKALERELKSIGATVILNRRGDTTLRPDDRCKDLISAKPDYCISIHHDSSTSSLSNGFGAFYSTPFSQPAAKYVYNATINKKIYNASAKNNRNRLEWHYFFMARMTVCPVVLTENGFMSSDIDFSGIKSDSVINKKAEAMATGIAKYFLSVRHGIPEEKYITEIKDTSSVTSSSTSIPQNSESQNSSGMDVSSVVSSLPPSSSEESTSDTTAEPADLY